MKYCLLILLCALVGCTSSPEIYSEDHEDQKYIVGLTKMEIQYFVIRNLALVNRIH